jgi:hypothetical protein
MPSWLKAVWNFVRGNPEIVDLGIQMGKNIHDTVEADKKKKSKKSGKSEIKKIRKSEKPAIIDRD